MNWIRLVLGIGIAGGAIWYFTRGPGGGGTALDVVPEDVDERDLEKRFDKVQDAAFKHGDVALRKKVAGHLKRAAAEADFGDMRKAAGHVRLAEQAVIAWAMQ